MFLGLGVVAPERSDHRDCVADGAYPVAANLDRSAAAPTSGLQAGLPEYRPGPALLSGINAGQTPALVEATAMMDRRLTADTGWF